MPAFGRGSQCASTAIYLAQYHGSPLSPYYWAAEGNPVNFTFERHGHICTTAAASADYSTPEATAVDPDDYAFASGTVTLPAPAHLGDPTVASRSTSTADDAEVESLQHFLVRIDQVEGAGRGIPTEVTALVIDEDGADRFSFGPGPVVAAESSPVISVPVVRLGPASAETTVQFSVGDPSDTAGPADYTGTTTGTLTFAPGDRVETISLSVVNDSRSELDETATVAISGATIDGPSTKSVTIQDNEEHNKPVSRWHHPKDALAYASGDFRLREIHVYADDDAPGTVSGVAKVQFALRKKMNGGSCRWWTPTGFAPAACAEKKWVRMGVYDQDPAGSGDGFYFFRLPKLSPSVGGTVRNYTAWSRAIDRAGNVESTFTVGRNANTFEVKRS